MKGTSLGLVTGGVTDLPTFLVLGAIQKRDPGETAVPQAGLHFSRVQVLGRERGRGEEGHFHPGIHCRPVRPWPHAQFFLFRSCYSHSPASLCFTSLPVRLVGFLECLLDLLLVSFPPTSPRSDSSSNNRGDYKERSEMVYHWDLVPSPNLPKSKKENPFPPCLSFPRAAQLPPEVT